MGVGRFVCVALPFGLTTASLVCILISMLAGITNKNLDMFGVNTANLSISSSSLTNLEDLVKRQSASLSGLTVASLETTVTSAVATSGINITAADLGLADQYKVSMWNYCSQTGSNITCSKAKFNWAASTLNITHIQETASSTSGQNVTLPKEMKTALNTFSTFSKWTEVVYIIALITCVVELFFGLFAICSRCGSCLTFLISGLSTITIIVASIMATVQSSIVVGAITSVTKAYGVKASLNTSFLATTWLAVAFSIGAGIFWSTTICCCAADHHSKPRNRSSMNEKLVPTGSYQRVEAQHAGFEGQQSGVYNQQQHFAPFNTNRAVRTPQQQYEPYSHAAI